MEKDFIGIWVQGTDNKLTVENIHEPCDIGFNDGENTFFIKGDFKTILTMLMNSVSDTHFGGVFSSK